MITCLIQTQDDLALPPAAWLTDAEQAEYAALRFAKRRQEWLAGRWTAKRLVQDTVAAAAACSVSLAQIELSPARGRAPLACWPGSRQPWPISISHCNDHAVAVVCDEPGEPLGVDLERVEVRPPGFADAYFTPAEIDSLGRGLDAQVEQVTAIWCGKEAALKALGVGLTVDTRAVNIGLDASSATWHGWRRLKVDASGADLRGWWRRHGPYLLTIVAGAHNGLATGWPVEIQAVVDQERVV